MNKILEVCCGSYLDALEAEKGGAKRIELNSALHLGGLTPSLSNLVLTKQNTNLNVICMVRNRAGGFCYDKQDLECMFYDAKMMLEHGADGLAFGFLKEDKSIDIELTTKMVELVHEYHKEAVFHRAIDVCSRYEDSFPELIACGVDRVLTSGSYVRAIEGVDRIRKMQQQYGDQIEILVGCGIDETNADYVLINAGVSQIHSSCKCIRHDPTSSNYGVNFSYIETNKYHVVDKERVKNMMEVIDKIK